MICVFHPHAEAEHLEAIAYYESRRPGIGARYLAEFERALTEACQTPEHFPIERKPDIRRVRLPRFPITILFRTANNNIEVLAVAHQRRRPAYWLGRL